MFFCSFSFVLLNLYKNSKPGDFLQVAGLTKSTLPMCVASYSSMWELYHIREPIALKLDAGSLFTVHEMVLLKFQFKLISWKSLMKTKKKIEVIQEIRLYKSELKRQSREPRGRIWMSSLGLL